LGQEATQSDLQAAIKLRGADVYADFLIPQLRPGATVLDCGCGAGTITLGLAEAVPDGHVIGVDLDLSGLKGAHRAAVRLDTKTSVGSLPTVARYHFTARYSTQSFVIQCWKRSMIRLRSLRSCGA
jgi:cyclopropane fatty-acyl-phospholipid synthase-like methyltransferase